MQVTDEAREAAAACVTAWDETRNGFNPGGDEYAGAKIIQSAIDAAYARGLRDAADKAMGFSRFRDAPDLADTPKIIAAAILKLEKTDG
jgi:hypothetical protein